VFVLSHVAKSTFMPPSDCLALPLEFVDEARGDVSSLVHGHGRALAQACFRGVRVAEIALEPVATGVGHLQNHLVALNIGGPQTWELAFEGSGWETRRLPHHAVAFVPAQLRHALRTTHPAELLAVEIAPEVLAAVRPGSDLCSTFQTQDAAVRHVLLALDEVARDASPHATFAAEALTAALVARLAGCAARPPAPTVANLAAPKLRRVLDYVSAHLDTPLSLHALAQLVDMDVFRFTRAFKQSAGVSPHRYVLHARVARAKELLRERDLPIAEVALRTGFATQSHFSVTFRRIANVTPRAYREELS
jgi:AraC family transcriptional regulator